MMKQIALLSVAGALALLLPACNQAAGPAESNAAASGDTDTKTVEALDAEFLAALKAKDFAKAKSFYASDAVMVVPGYAPYEGAESIGKFFDGVASDPAATFEGTSEGVVMSSGGDLAYARGTYRAGYTDSETKAPVNDRGYYLVVFKKQSDGSWKIVQDVSTPQPPAAS